MLKKGDDVARAWLDYSLMKNGLEPWNMPAKYYFLYGECMEAEFELLKRAEKMKK
jgi:hypothetical protein